MRNLIVIALIAVALFQGWKHFGSPASAGPAAALPNTPADIRALAQTVRQDEVVMYSTTECPYCAQARGWLRDYGFAYTECNMSVDRHCESEFRSHGGLGVPYLIVRGHHMRDGFDSDEFLGALQGQAAN